MRSRRTTYLLLFLAFAFILTIIILCYSPGHTQHQGPQSGRIEADIAHTNEVTESTTSPSRTTDDDDSGWATSTPKTTTKTSSKYTDTQTTASSDSTTVKPTTTVASTSTESLTTTETSTTTTTVRTTTTKAPLISTDSSTITTDTSATTTKVPTTTTETQTTTTETPAIITDTPTTATETKTTITETTKNTTETPITTTHTPATTTETPATTSETPTTTTETHTTTTETPTTTTETPTTTTETPTTATETPTITTETPTTTPETPTTTTETPTTTTESPTTTAETTSQSSKTTPTKSITTTTVKPTTPVDNTGPCITDDCKRIASKMLHSIDHSAHNCEDFYQYSCGGVEADTYLSPEDPNSVFDAIIKEELFKSGQHDVSTFYESCKNTTNSAEIIQEYLLQISETKFTTHSQTLDQLSSSELLSIFFKQNFPLFFDVTAEPCDSKQYCLRLSLSLPAASKMEENYCLGPFTSKMKAARNSEEVVDLNAEYEKYRLCMVKPAVNVRIAKLQETLNKLNISLLKLTDDIDEILDEVKEFLEEYYEMNKGFDPSKVRKEMVMEENYELLTVEGLEKDTDLKGFIDWKTFLSKLELELDPHRQVRVYHKEKLKKMIQLLGKFEKNTTLRDIILVLWIEHLSNNFDPTNDGTEDYCFRQTKQLMPLHVQLLFLQHLNSTTLDRVKKQIGDIGEAAIQEIRDSISSSQIENVTLANADAQYLENKIINTYNEKNQEAFAYNLTNVIKLNEIIRSNNYKLLTSSEVDSADNIFLLKDHGSHYQLMNNILLIPPTSIVDSAFLSDEAVPIYLKLAGVTNVIVNALMTQFNVTELNITGNAALSACVAREASGIHKRKIRFGNEATFKVYDRSVLHEFGSFGLNWKILQQLVSSGGESVPTDLSESHEKSLIWFGKTPLSPIKAYFIRKTQMECSGSRDVDLLRTFVDSQLPSRERMNLLLKHEPFFAHVFNCSQESKMSHGNNTCLMPEESTEFPPLFSSTVKDYDYDDAKPQPN